MVLIWLKPVSVDKRSVDFWFPVVTSDGFAHRPNRPWPRDPRFRGPRATTSYEKAIINFKIAKLRRGITSHLLAIDRQCKCLGPRPIR